MALSGIKVDGNPPMAGVNGVFQGQTSPELLGLDSLSLKVGNFFVGFDTRIKPAIARIFFDPNPFGNTEPYDTIGLINVGQITYQGVPISPDTYGMNLGHLTPYNFSNSSDVRKKHHWVDMIDVTTLRKKALERGGVSFYPLFPYNGYLRNINYTPQDFYTHPMPNGSLTSIPPQQVTRASLCASLFDAIDFDLDLPPENRITAMVKRMAKNVETPFKSATYSQDTVLGTGPLNLAITLLEITDPTTIEDVQVAGPFMIITMTDVEAEGPIFIAFFDGAQATETTSTMVIYLVDEDELEQQRFAALTNTFENIKNRFEADGILGGAGLPTASPPRVGKGNKGLNPFPFFFTKDTNPEIAFTYNTVAIGIEDNHIVTCFDCLKWTVSRIFDRSTLEFGPLLISKPVLNKAASRSFTDLLADRIEDDRYFIFPVIDQWTDALRGISSSGYTNPYFYEDNKGLITPASQAIGDGSTTWKGS
jgi:hypothetical protein